MHSLRVIGFEAVDTLAALFYHRNCGIGNERWVCRFKDYDHERRLALHRVISAKASTSFNRPKEFDLQKYDDDGRFGFGEGKRIHLTFKINNAAGQHLLESPLSTDQKVVDLDDAYDITATVMDSEMLDWWLRGLGMP